MSTEQKNGFVYKWTNKISGKWYIGSHQGSEDDGYIGSGIAFRRAVEKYGISDFVREILYRGDDFKEHEERILNELNAAADKNSYNIKNQAFGASLFGSLNGMHQKLHEEIAIEQIRQSSIKRWQEPGVKEKWSVFQSGSGNPMFGKNHSEFSIQKMKTTKLLKKIDFPHLKQEKHHRHSFMKIFRALKKGRLISPRGQLVLEVENFSYELPPYVRFQSFAARNFNLKYVKNELLWYLKGDRFDSSICDKAKIWKSIVNSDGSINSNYGQYIFGALNQFDRVVEILRNDRDSRRASISILSSEHLLSDTNDVPCTYALNFRIRDGHLNMSVHMRSQDAIFGMGNDAPAFSIIHEMLVNSLSEFYPELQYGSYFHTVDSFHVYERHFEMFEQLVNKHSRYRLILCPKISGPEEVRFLRKLDFEQIPDEFKFTKWLCSNED